jgi:DNA-binding NtrC family response regulator
MAARDDDDVRAEATTVARPRVDAAALGVVAYELSVVEGPDTGRRFVLDAAAPGRALLGKGPACELRLNDPSVSRRHAALEVAGTKLALSDLGSTNGTFVDGIEALSALLKGGELVRVGATALRVERTVASGGHPAPAGGFGGVIGASPAMRRLYPLCARLATSMVPVVIEGETGTGKEQLAEALHQAGPRATGPFVVFDCTAVAPNLIESELFGHERGAFTGSVATRRGVFERAHGGTLLIDEIGDLPLPLQPKLLRAIERGETQRMGGEASIRVDARLLFATRRDLDREVALGRFRDDLFHRMAVARLELPPLRARGGDIALLARHFAVELGARPDVLDPGLLARWQDYGWPGNVRELRNAVARRLALGDLAGDGLPESASPRTLEATSGDTIARVLAMSLPLTEAREHVLIEFERRYLQHVLVSNRGNVTRAAAAAGVARRHLHRLKARLFPGTPEGDE